MKRPILYDVFCGAGGATKGYQRAGFYVIGVDYKPQERYCGDEFIQMDAIKFLMRLLAGEFKTPAAIHTSPPCQKHSTMTKGRWQDKLGDHVNLIPGTRKLLQKISRPYVIENVPGAKNEMINPITLCGTMFNLRARNGAQLWRHRLFECDPPIWFPPTMCHHEKTSAIGVYGGGQHPLRKNANSGVYGNSGGTSARDGKSFYGIEDRRTAMGIDWMTGKELNQAIPPAYTEWLGRQLINILEVVTK